MSTVKLTADQDISVFSPEGTHSIAILAGEVTDVPLQFVSRAAELGAYAPNEKPAKPAAAGPIEPEKLEAVVQAMRKIIAEAVPEKLDAAGIPRVSEIEEVVGFKVSKKLREEAWTIVEG